MSGVTDSDTAHVADEVEARRPPSGVGAPGAEVPGGPWRVTVACEGKDKRLFSYAETKALVSRGLASQKGAELSWNPRYHKENNKWRNWDGNPSTTVLRAFPKTKLRDGVTVHMQWFSAKDPTLPNVDYSEAWVPKENVNNLRCVAGTGDFRVGLFQSGGAPDPGTWHGYQVRFFPHLHRDAKKYIGKDDASNASHWYRQTPSEKNCLIDDWSQEWDHSGFKKLKHKGEAKFGTGPHSPYDEWFDVKVRLQLTGPKTIKSTVTFHKDVVELDAYQHETTKFSSAFEEVDTVAVSFNNMRPYCGLKIRCVNW
jgi:hypothetical protein